MVKKNYILEKSFLKCAVFCDKSVTLPPEFFVYK